MSGEKRSKVMVGVEVDLRECFVTILWKIIGPSARQKFKFENFMEKYHWKVMKICFEILF